MWSVKKVPRQLDSCAIHWLNSSFLSLFCHSRSAMKNYFLFMLCRVCRERVMTLMCYIYYDIICYFCFQEKKEKTSWGLVKYKSEKVGTNSSSKSTVVIIYLIYRALPSKGLQRWSLPASFAVVIMLTHWEKVYVFFHRAANERCSSKMNNKKKSSIKRQQGEYRNIFSSSFYALISVYISRWARSVFGMMMMNSWHSSTRIMLCASTGWKFFCCFIFVHVRGIVWTWKSFQRTFWFICCCFVPF